jgi:hypothetical protein
LILGCLCIGFAVVIFHISTLSFEQLKKTVSASIPPGYEDRFTAVLYRKGILGLRFATSLLAVAGAAVIWFAESVGCWWTHARGRVATVVHDFRAGLAALMNDRLHAVALAAICIWAIFLRICFLFDPIHRDEAYSFMHYASRPLFVGLAYYTANNHLLNTALMHISTTIFGTSEWTVRLPTLVVGVLLVPATYVLVRLTQDRTGALLTAAMVSAASPLIEYSVNGRGYTLGALFFVLMLGFIKLAQRGFESAWIGIPVAAALALYSVPTMLYGVGGAFLYLLLLRTDIGHSTRAILFAGGLTLALYTPALLVVGPLGIFWNQWVQPIPRTQWPGQMVRELGPLWAYWNTDLPRLLGGLIMAGVLIALVPRRGRRLVYEMPPGALICVLATASILVAAQTVVPYRRTWLFVVPLYLATGAAGLNMPLRKLRCCDGLAIAFSLTFAAWMGATVLLQKSLRHSDAELPGGRSAEQIVLAVRNRLAHGAQFVCAEHDYFDASLDFYMQRHGVPYLPVEKGELLIVTPHGKSPDRTLDMAGVQRTDVLAVRLLAQFEDEDVYVAQRSPNLIFQPHGRLTMGLFTATTGSQSVPQ